MHLRIFYYTIFGLCSSCLLSSLILVLAVVLLGFWVNPSVAAQAPKRRCAQLSRSILRRDGARFPENSSRSHQLHSLRDLGNLRRSSSARHPNAGAGSFWQRSMYLEGKSDISLARVCPDPSLAAAADPFDRIHDSILLHVFNCVGDIKALGRCCVVSKRFHSLVFLVENVTVKVDCVISGEDSGPNAKGRGVFGHLVRLLVGSILKPLQFLQHILGPKKAMLAEVSHHSPGEVLKNFKAIQNLRIELPGGELGIEDGVLLKWRAEFGSTLHSCVILGASALVKPVKEKKRDKFDFGKPWFLQSRYDERGPVGGDNPESAAQDDGGSLPESFYTNGGLKLRVVWTISSLIAASARHYLLQQIISEHPTLISLVLTDADGQGTLCMSKEHLHEFKNKPLAASASSNRTQVPALNMKLWYAPYLELPGGTGLKGATLVAIRPSDQPVRKEVDGFVSAAFEEPFQSAASLLVKRRTYLLEMNSF